MSASVRSIKLSMFVALALSAATLHAETVERRSDADPRGEVEIVNVAGTVHVAGWDKNEITVHAELGRDVERLDFTRNGSHTLIKVVLPSGNFRRGETDLVIQVPRDSRIVTNTVSADQTVDAVRGAQRLQSVSGEVRTQFGNGELQIRTVSGDIVAMVQGAEKNASPLIRINTVSGSVDLRQAMNDVDVRSVSGDIHVDAKEISRAQLSTTSGDLQFSGSLTRDARVEAQSVSGDLMLSLTGTIDAEFDIESFSGDIENCFGESSRRTREHGPGKELRFKQGDGKGSVRVKSMSGDISVCK